MGVEDIQPDPKPTGREDDDQSSSAGAYLSPATSGDPNEQDPPSNMAFGNFTPANTSSPRPLLPPERTGSDSRCGAAPRVGPPPPFHLLDDLLAVQDGFYGRLFEPLENMQGAAGVGD